MNKLCIIYVDDQPELGPAVQKDLSVMNDILEIFTCLSATEAFELIEDLDAAGTATALVISDQVMPEKNGVDFLAELKSDYRFDKTKTILLTGQASHEDTIRAINEVNIDSYISKPWKKDDLLSHVKTALTNYLIGSGCDYKAYLPYLDQDLVYKDMH